MTRLPGQTPKPKSRPVVVIAIMAAGVVLFGVITLVHFMSRDAEEVSPPKPASPPEAATARQSVLEELRSERVQQTIAFHKLKALANQHSGRARMRALAQEVSSTAQRGLDCLARKDSSGARRALTAAKAKAVELEAMAGLYRKARDKCRECKVALAGMKSALDKAAGKRKRRGGDQMQSRAAIRLEQQRKSLKETFAARLAELQKRRQVLVRMQKDEAPYADLLAAAETLYGQIKWLPSRTEAHLSAVFESQQVYASLLDRSDDKSLKRLASEEWGKIAPTVEAAEKAARAFELQKAEGLYKQAVRHLVAARKAAAQRTHDRLLAEARKLKAAGQKAEAFAKVGRALLALPDSQDAADLRKSLADRMKIQKDPAMLVMSRVTAAAFLPGGQQVIAAVQRNDVPSPPQKLFVFRRASGPRVSVVESPSPETHTVPMPEGLCLPVDLHNRKPIPGTRTLTDVPKGIHLAQLSVSADGKVAMGSDPSGRMVLWSIADGPIMRTVDVRGRGYSGSSWMSSTLLPDGRRLAANVAGTRCFIWDPSKVDLTPMSEELYWDVPKPDPRFVQLGAEDGCQAILGSRDGKLVACIIDDRVGAVFDATDGELLRDPFEHGQEKEISALALADDGRLLATGGDDGLIRIWDTRSGTCIKTMANTPKAAQPGAVHLLAFSPGGNLLLSGNAATVKLWDPIAGRYLRDVAARYPRARISTNALGVMVLPSEGEAGKDGTLIFDSTGKRFLLVEDSPLIRTFSITW